MAAGALAVLVLAAGCATIPDSGGVHAGRLAPAVGGLEENDIRVLPPPPRPGVGPAAVVSGFLSALVYSDNGYGVARSYLAPGTQWRPAAGITMFDEARLSVVRTATNTVVVRAPRVGVINGRGEFRRSSGDIVERFTITRSSGEWRIARLPSTVVLSTFDASRSLQDASVYYLNRDLNRLVPDQLLLSVEPAGLATTLVRTLLAGPSGPLASAVRTAVPPGTPLQGNVPVDDNGVAEVDLPATVRQLPGAALARLSAQLVWTLRNISGITAVRLLADGRPLAAPGVPSVQPLTAWPAFDPAGPVEPGSVVVVSHGRVAGLGGPAPAALAGRRLAAPAVGSGASQVAALRRRGATTELRSGPAAGSLRTRLRAGSLSPPALGPDGDVLVATGGPNPRVVMVPPSGPARTVPVPSRVLGRGIDALAVSRDGARIAMVVGPVGHRALAVGLLAQLRGVLTVTDVHVVIPGSADVSGLAWSQAGSLVTTTRAGAGRAVVRTDVDGYQQEPLSRTGLPSDIDSVAAAPHQPVLASDGHGIWSLTGTRWRWVSTGADPAYPG